MTAIEQALALLRPDEAQRVDVAAGYVDALRGRDPTGRRPGQRLMASRALPLIYERLWRPLGARLLIGTGLRAEYPIALDMLRPARDERVLDVACGPGNFTRVFADVAELAVGLDASRTMLAQAVRETAAANVAYLRADASALPFRDATFDAVCCFAALYLIEQPLRAVAEIARVLAPGGRVALLASVNRGLLPAAVADAFVRPLSGVRIFGRDDLTRALREQGLTDVQQRITGFAQFVSARRPAGPWTSRRPAVSRRRPR